MVFQRIYKMIKRCLPLFAILVLGASQLPFLSPVSTAGTADSPETPTPAGLAATSTPQTTNLTGLTPSPNVVQVSDATQTAQPSPTMLATSSLAAASLPSARVLTPVADSFVDISQPTMNFGERLNLRVDHSPAVRSYLRFDLGQVSGTVTQARLRVFANTASTSGISVSPVQETIWSETGLISANAPTAGPIFATSGAVSAESWQELDLTGLVRGGGLVSLALDTPGETSISLASRESGDNTPQLVITTSDSATLLAAGDMTKCFGGTPDPTSGAMIVSDMLLKATGSIFTLGDNSNDAGSAADFANCVDPSWGRLKARLHPALGNHDVINNNQGTPYFNYFGAAAHPESFGHYSLNLGSWHIIVLNSDCSVGSQGCSAGSPQEQWLKADLAAHPNQCTLALWHQPLFTSGTQIPTLTMRAFWQDLYAAHADVILNGHNHNYERFAPQDPAGKADTINGIREFIVGTGGASLDASKLPLAANEALRSAQAYGYLQLTLKPGGYDWKFVAQPGSAFSDSGSATCH
jgi:acid phosphatase type 7